MMQFYINKGQSGYIPEEYPLPFNEKTVTVTPAKDYYKGDVTAKYSSYTTAEKGDWRVAVNLERRKEFNCEWCLCPDLQKSGFMEAHVTCAYPKRSAADLTDVPWTNRDYEYNEQKMDMPIPADELTKNPLCD